MRYNRHVIAFKDHKLVEEKSIELERLNLELQEANKKLEELTRIDGMTGIYNRIMFDRTIRAEWDRCRRHGMPLTLMMVDVDFFKSFNDNSGHQAGDICIRRIAEALSDCAKRASDSVARYGGRRICHHTSRYGVKGCASICGADERKGRGTRDNPCFFQCRAACHHQFGRLLREPVRRIIN